MIYPQYIRDCIAKSERPALSLVQRASLKVELNVTGKSAPGPENRPPPPVPSKESGLSLWSIDTHLKVKIASAFNVNVIEHMKVRCLLYFEGSKRCKLQTYFLCKFNNSVESRFDRS